MPTDDPYDLVPYTDHAYAEAHPDRLVVVGRLKGWDTGALERGRVLELGCGRGGNLLPMAAGMPGASFVGIDRSERQIDEAKRIASASGLTNVSFEVAGVEDTPPGPAEYDFVLCHGVYSWVPVETRRAMLRTAARALAPKGIAYVSFNTLPGWYERLAARDWLRFCASSLPRDGGPEHARDALAWLVCHVSPELEPYRERLRGVSRRLEETDRAYLVHEYLAAEHHPETVTTFLGEAELAGLSYLGDAILQATALELLPDPVAAEARRMTVSAGEQLTDFVRCTSFRRALLVRAPVGWSTPRDLAPSALESLRVASRMRDTGGRAELFAGPSVTVQVSEPAVQVALRELGRIAPRSLPFSELVAAVGRAMPGRAPTELRATLVRELFDLWLASDGLDLHAFEPPMTTSPGERPEACPVARWHAANGGSITNRWHHEVRLEEPIVTYLLGRLDGTRTIADLAVEAKAALARGPSSPAPVGPRELEGLVRGAVDLLANAGLLVG